MKYLAVSCLLVMLTCRCGRIETISRLQTDQKLLKDSANTINERIGRFIQKGMYDSAEIQRIQLGAVQARLSDIQSSIDSRLKKK